MVRGAGTARFWGKSETLGRFLLVLEEGFALLRAECPPLPPSAPQIAVYGTNFCTSARNAFSLLMRNIIRVVVLDKVTDFLLFLGKLLIVGGVGVLAFFFFTHRIKLVEDTAPTLNYYWVPILELANGRWPLSAGHQELTNGCCPWVVAHPALPPCILPP
uniref:Choline transporter-like protein n=1 Tax=Meleagris gallopavo TaxID=9103 RepID=A0A803YLT5_MELGA